MKAIQARDENLRNSENKLIRKLKLSYNLIEKPNELYLKAWDFLKGHRDGLPNMKVKRSDLIHSSGPQATKSFKSFMESFHDIKEVKQLTSVLDRIIILETTSEEASNKLIKNKWTAVKISQSKTLEKYSQDIKNMNLNGIIADPVEKHNMISTLIKNDDDFVRNKFIGEQNKRRETESSDSLLDLDIRKLLQRRPGFPLSVIEQAIKEGLDINAFDKNLDATLLMYASSIGNLKLGQILVRKSASIDLRNVIFN